jgi:hypothetical protein
MSAILFTLLFTLSPAFSQIYRWTDEKGTIHFSDNPSSLPKDYSVDKKRSAAKDDAEKESITPSGKPELEKKTAIPQKKTAVPLEKPKPADKLDQLPAQPPEPAKPTTEDKVIVPIKPTGENVIKENPPVGTTPTPPAATTPTSPVPKKFEPPKKPEIPPAIPGDPLSKVRTKPTMMAGAIVGIIGLILSAVGGIWFLVAAFKVSIWWGLACLFLAPAQLVFLFKHWREARKPFAVGLLAMGVILVGVYLMVEDPLGFLSQYRQLKG